MEAHQQRVVDEKTELDDKIMKLRVFIGSNPIFFNLPVEDQGLLEEQLYFMERYSKILGFRIKRF